MAQHEITMSPLFLERAGRLKTAVACDTPDRIPLSLLLDSFAARTMGVKLSEYVQDVDLAGEVALATMEKLGDVDSIQTVTYAPAALGMLWLAPVKLPGQELSDESLWQLDEQVRIQPEDYDRILEMGWGPWFGEYTERYLGEAFAAEQALYRAAHGWAVKFIERGYVPYTTGFIYHPVEQLCGGRTVQEFTLDLFHMPEKVEAVIEAIMRQTRELARQTVRKVGPHGYWVGSWRTAPQFLSPRLWSRFVWPQMKELVEIVAEEGGTPVLHYDGDWDREIERLLELPKGKCILALDGQTDIFRAKRILAGHMCIMGDVPPALLTLGTADEVKAYCDRLLAEVGPDGYIMAMGCAVPPDAKFENVQALVDSVKG